MLPVDTKPVPIYIRSSVGSQEIFPLDLKLQDHLGLWVIVSSASLPWMIRVQCGSVTKVLWSLVVLAVVFCLWIFLPPTVLWEWLSLNDMIPPKPVCLGIGSVCFALEVRAETFLPLMFVLPVFTCLKMGMGCNYVNICFPVMGFIVSKEKVFQCSWWEHVIQYQCARPLRRNCVCFLLGIWFCSKEAYGPESQQNVGPEGYWELWNPTARLGAGPIYSVSFWWMHRSQLI